MPAQSTFHTPLAPDDVHIWCIRLESTAELLESAYQTLSPGERSRAARFLVDPPRNTFVLARAVLRRLLAGLNGGTAEDLQFGYSKEGKPFLLHQLSTMHFNMSHSGDLAAYAITLAGEVGIDVEQHRSMPDLEAIAQRFFSAREHKSLSQVPEPERIPAFFDCWVRKEAYLKARGGGLSIGLDNFHVSLAPGEPAALLAIDDPAENAREWFLHAFTPAPGFSGALALRQQQCRVHLHRTVSATDVL
jgi:4'-phosphopantetheinyl transferase